MPPPPSRLRRAAPILVLLGLTVFAGLLRFHRLDAPALWGDDAATFSRVCGTYQQMLEVLRNAGFGPLHYQLLWWIGQGMPLPGGTVLVPGGIPFTPQVMRFVPALSGTLMVPAIYFLVVQLASRRTALLAALLAACSAYLLNYSRDAKMYMPLWLFITLHVGSLLWFLRSRSLTSWLCFVAAGCAMLGLQLVSFAILAIDLLIVFTARRGHWSVLPRLLVGAAWAPLLPIAGLFDRLDRFAHHDGRLAPLRRGLRTLPLHAIGSRGPAGRAMRCFGSTYRLPVQLPVILPVLLGLLICSLGPIGYTRYFNNFAERVIGENASDVDLGSAGISWVNSYNRQRTGGDLVLFTASAYLSGWEWPRLHDQPPIDPRTLRLLTTANLAMIGLLLIGLLPWRAAWAWVRARREMRRREIPPHPHPAGPGLLRWRAVAWILAWLLLPTYGFYAFSIRDAAAPTDLLLSVALRDHQPATWPHFPGGIEDRQFRGEKRPGLEDYRAFASALPASARQTLENAAAATVRWPVVIAVAALAAIGLFLAGTTWRQRLRALLAAATITLVLITLAMLLHLAIHQSPGSAWMPRYLAVIFPAFLVTVAVLMRRLPTRPLRVVAVTLFVVVNLVQYRSRVNHGEPPTDVIAADLLRDEADPATRVFHAVRVRMGMEPGTATFGSLVLRQYLAVGSGMEVAPRDIRTAGRLSKVDQRFVPQPSRDRDAIRRELRRDPGLRTIIVWSQLAPGAVDQLDELGDALAPAWKRTEDRTWVAYDHWTWGQWAQLRRRIYVKVAEAAEEPARPAPPAATPTPPRPTPPAPAPPAATPPAPPPPTPTPPIPAPPTPAPQPTPPPTPAAPATRPAASTRPASTAPAATRPVPPPLTTAPVTTPAAPPPPAPIPPTPAPATTAPTPAPTTATAAASATTPAPATRPAATQPTP